MFPIDIDFSRLLEAFKYNPDAPMIFSSGIFLWLFAAFMVIYTLLQHRNTARILFVALFSYYFYYKSSGTYFFLLAIVTVTDFMIAWLMDRTDVRWKRKFCVVLSVSVNLGLLCYFKYTNFLGGVIASLMGGEFTALDIFLPVGISFFTFQSLSYTIDVYRKEIKPLTSLLDYAFYVSFFPQLVAGPIVRARDFIPQIRKPLYVSQEMFGRGIFLIVAGLFKKAVISDYISINFVERIFDNPTLYSGVENLMGLYGYALQIYCDFSGYSDMAIGIALLLGFHFNLNFNSPYKSASITEFWRRWHISLSSWLRDYIYIPLGGNRKGTSKKYRNLIIVFLISGLWHGASWSFVFWGLFHGLLQIVEQLIHLSKETSNSWVRCLKILLNFILVTISWVFFKVTDIHQALAMLQKALFFPSFKLNLNVLKISPTELMIALFFISVIIILDILRNRADMIKWFRKRNLIIRFFVYIILFSTFLILGVYGTGYDANQFIYIQF